MIQDEKKEIFLVTWVTYCSRVSERMVAYHVEKKDGINLGKADEVFITDVIKNIVLRDKLICFAYNICVDHIHIILKCHSSELPKIVQKLKAVSARRYNILKGKTVPVMNKGACSPVHEKVRGVTQNHLWAQKFNKSYLNNEKQLVNAIKYVRNNRIKHELVPNDEVEYLAQRMVQDYFQRAY